MSGLGSRGGRSTVEDSYKLDVGLILRGVSFTDWIGISYSWMSDDRLVGTVWCRVSWHDRIPLTLTISCEKDDVPFKQIIDLVQEPMPKGGYRTLARCPGCYRRAFKLFLPYWSGRWKCRKCLDLTYESSLESSKGRGKGMFAQFWRYTKLDDAYYRPWEARKRYNQKRREWRAKRKRELSPDPLRFGLR